MNMRLIYTSSWRKEKPDEKQKDTKSYFHHVTNGHARDRNLHSKRWSLMQNGSVNIFRSIIRLLLLLALWNTGCMQHLQEARSYFLQGLFQNSKQSPRQRHTCTTCLTCPAAKLKENLSAQSSVWKLKPHWVSQSNLGDFCLFLLYM